MQTTYLVSTYVNKYNRIGFVLHKNAAIYATYTFFKQEGLRKARKPECPEC